MRRLRPLDRGARGGAWAVMQGEGTRVGAPIGRADPHQELSVQPAPAISRAEQAALESLQGRIAENGADDRAVVCPYLLGGRLISAGWKHGDDASLIGFAKVSVQRRRYRAEGRRVDTGVRARRQIAHPPKSLRSA